MMPLYGLRLSQAALDMLNDRARKENVAPGTLATSLLENALGIVKQKKKGKEEEA